MGLISISVLVASVVYVLVRPPPWMPLWFVQWRQGHLPTLASGRASPEIPSIRTNDGSKGASPHDETPKRSESARRASSSNHTTTTTGNKSNDTALMPPPPLPVITPTPSISEPAEETTPKAEPTVPSFAVPSLSLNETNTPSSASALPTPSWSMPPPPRPSAAQAGPSNVTASTRRIPSLGQFPAAQSPQRARGPAPSRGPPASSGLAPPPTITAKPQKPSRKVLLEPGHSPLDWASISGPNADLRGVPPETPYLRVTPSMLKDKTGRKGKDAWMAINGKVYNVTPYAKFHPGGVPELMRAAGRDGTKLFWEIHPWVNYDTMLAACLVGLMVDEPEGSGPSKMDEMD